MAPRVDGPREARAPRGIEYEAHTPRGRQDFGTGLGPGTLSAWRYTRTSREDVSRAYLSTPPDRQPVPSVRGGWGEYTLAAKHLNKLRGGGWRRPAMLGVTGDCFSRVLPPRSGGRWRRRRRMGAATRTESSPAPSTMLRRAIRA